MEKEQLQDLNRLGVIERRFEILALARFRDKTKIREAIKVQDKIRKKTKGGVNLTQEIRKWRDKRK